MWNKRGASRRTDPVTLERLTTESVIQRAISVLGRAVADRRRHQTGDTMNLDQRGSAVLSEEECRSLLERAAAVASGRIAINGARSPYVVPVNFTVVDGGIMIRLGPGWAAFHLDGTAVTFEIDHATASGAFRLERRGPGCGPRRHVRRGGPAREQSPHPAVTEPGVRVFEIVPFRVTGRLVEPNFRGEQTKPEPVKSTASCPLRIRAPPSHPRRPRRARLPPAGDAGRSQLGDC